MTTLYVASGLALTPYKLGFPSHHSALTYWPISGNSMTADAVTLTLEDKAAARRGKPKAHANLRVVTKVQIDPSRDALLTDFGKKTLDDRYVLPGETYQDMFARVATAYSDDAEHA